jgi:Lhr-like helicase
MTPVGERVVVIMKKHSTRNRISKRKLVLRLEHIVELTPEQLRQVPPGASGEAVSCGDVCSKAA